LWAYLLASAAELHAGEGINNLWLIPIGAEYSVRAEVGTGETAYALLVVNHGKPSLCHLSIHLLSRKIFPSIFER
jgi:hypothetical protein